MELQLLRMLMRRWRQSLPRFLLFIFKKINITFMEIHKTWKPTNLVCLTKQSNTIIYAANYDKKSPTNAKSNAQQRTTAVHVWKPCKTKSVAREHQTTGGYLSIVLYLYSPEGVTCLTLPTPYQLKITNFPYPLSFSTLVRGDPLQIYGKAL